MHLVADITAHGYGHIALTAPVLDALARRVPDLRVTVRCAFPREVLAARIAVPFAHVPEALDVAMIMTSALEVDARASAAAYADFHRSFALRVDEQAAKLAALAPDLLLANVPHLSLAAAAKAGIPRAALCCLNWADIYLSCCGDEPGAIAHYEAMIAAYDGAPFLCPEPSMPMPRLPRTVSVGPIARLGQRRRAAVDDALGTAKDERLVLVALGGIPTRLPMERWPHIPGVRWLIPAAWEIRRPDAASIERLGMSFTDVLCSCDAVITKPGYGTFTEAACNGVPVLYLPRPGWPEAPVLVRWLEENARCGEIERGVLERGEIAAALDALLALPEKPRPRPTGAEEAARVLAQIVGGSA